MSRPNIVILMCDQLGAGALSAYSHPLVKSPHIDSIAARAAVFDNCYSSFPLCVPARLSLMTGKRCSNIGAWDNAAQLAPDISTFAHYLRALGHALRPGRVPERFGRISLAQAEPASQPAV